jgi:hypothetical protein
VAAVTELQFSGNSGNGREDGFGWLRANGSWNVGVEAHHALISRSKWIEWTPELIDRLPGGRDDRVKSHRSCRTTGASPETRFCATAGACSNPRALPRESERRMVRSRELAKWEMWVEGSAAASPRLESPRTTAGEIDCTARDMVKQDDVRRAAKGTLGLVPFICLVAAFFGKHNK